MPTRKVLSNKFVILFGGLSFYCPACEELHTVHTNAYNERNSQVVWQFNNNLECPTLSPSVRVQGVGVCHFFLKEGYLEFCGDCTHAMANQRVALPNLPDWVVNSRHIMNPLKD